MTYMLCFFFSSRRRHTRLQGDWSSDVCSSDLHGGILYRSPGDKWLWVDRWSGAPTYADAYRDAERVDVVAPTHGRSEEHTSELQSPCNLVCRLLLEKKKK